jgi:hypothetical protein
MYLETTRICCASRKKKDDYVKLWRQCNDGITWVYNSCSPARNQFCLLGLQIFGTNLINLIYQLYNYLCKVFKYILAIVRDLYLNAIHSESIFFKKYSIHIPDIFRIRRKLLIFFFKKNSIHIPDIFRIRKLLIFF